MTPEVLLRSAGYLSVPGAIPVPAADELMSAAFASVGGAPSATTRLEQVHSIVDVAGTLRGSHLDEVLTSIFGGGWGYLTNRHNHITVDTDGTHRSTRLHRDALTWVRSFLTVLVKLSPAQSARHDGVRLIPASQAWAFELSNGGGAWLDEQPYAHLADQVVELGWRAGDAIIVDPLTYHAGGSGSPRRPRTVLALAVRGHDELLHEPAPNEIPVSGHHRYLGQRWWTS